MVYKLNITSPAVIKAAIELTGASLLPELQTLPGIKGVPGAYEMVVIAGRMAYAEAYKYVYYASIAFGAVSIIAACFLGDINKYSKCRLLRDRWSVLELIFLSGRPHRCCSALIYLRPVLKYSRQFS